LGSDPNFQRDLNNLQWVDALTLQADRHNRNIMVDVQNGRYQSLKGIDSDMCFGLSERPLKSIVARTNGPDHRQNPNTQTYGFNAGLPPLIDEAVFLRLIEQGAAESLLMAANGLLTLGEMLRYKDRIDEVIAHAKSLAETGCVVGLNVPAGAPAGVHPWLIHTTPDPQNPNNRWSAQQMLSNPGNSYYGRMTGAPQLGAKPTAP